MNQEKIKPNIQFNEEDEAPLSDENSDESVKELTGIKSKRIRQKITNKFDEEKLSDDSAHFVGFALRPGETIDVKVQKEFLERMMSIFPKVFSK